MCVENNCWKFHLIAMAGLSKTERERAFGMLLAGTSKTDAARAVGCIRATVHAQWNRHNQTGRPDGRPRHGAPRSAKLRKDRLILISHLCNRHLTTASTCRTLFRGRVSSKTVSTAYFRIESRFNWSLFTMAKQEHGKDHLTIWQTDVFSCGIDLVGILGSWIRYVVIKKVV